MVFAFLIYSIFERNLREKDLLRSSGKLGETQPSSTLNFKEKFELINAVTVTGSNTIIF